MRYIQRTLKGYMRYVLCALKSWAVKYVLYAIKFYEVSPVFPQELWGTSSVLTGLSGTSSVLTGLSGTSSVLTGL